MIKPMELRQDIKAIENEPIKTRLESLKETSAVLWNAKRKLEQLFCMQMYIASEILQPIFAPSKVWIANMNYDKMMEFDNDCDSILMPFIIGANNENAKAELKTNQIHHNRAFKHIFHINDTAFETLEIMLYLNSDSENLPNFHQLYDKAMLMLNDWLNKSSRDDLKDTLAEVQNDKNIEKL